MSGRYITTTTPDGVTGSIVGASPYIIQWSNGDQYTPLQAFKVGENTQYDKFVVDFPEQHRWGVLAAERVIVEAIAAHASQGPPLLRCGWAKMPSVGSGGLARRQSASKVLQKAASCSGRLSNGGRCRHPTSMWQRSDSTRTALRRAQ